MTKNIAIITNSRFNFEAALAKRNEDGFNFVSRSKKIAEMAKGGERIKLWWVGSIVEASGIKWHEVEERIDFNFGPESIKPCQDAWEVVSQRISPTRPPYLPTI